MLKPFVWRLNFFFFFKGIEVSCTCCLHLSSFKTDAEKWKNSKLRTQVWLNSCSIDSPLTPHFLHWDWRKLLFHMCSVLAVHRTYHFRKCKKQKNKNKPVWLHNKLVSLLLLLPMKETSHLKTRHAGDLKLILSECWPILKRKLATFLIKYKTIFQGGFFFLIHSSSINNLKL